MSNPFLPPPGTIIRLPGSIAPRPQVLATAGSAPAVQSSIPASAPAATVTAVKTKETVSLQQPSGVAPNDQKIAIIVAISALIALLVAVIAMVLWSNRPAEAEAKTVTTQRLVEAQIVDKRPLRRVVYYTAPMPGQQVIESTDGKGCSWLAVVPTGDNPQTTIHPKLAGNRQSCKTAADTAIPKTSVVRGQDLPQVPGSAIVILDVLDEASMQSLGIPDYVMAMARQPQANILTAEGVDNTYMTASDPRLTPEQAAEVRTAVAAAVRSSSTATRKAVERRVNRPAQYRAPPFIPNYPMPDFGAPMPMPGISGNPMTAPRVSDRPTAGQPNAAPLQPVRSAQSITAQSRGSNTGGDELIVPTVDASPPEVRVGPVNGFSADTGTSRGSLQPILPTQGGQ